MGIETTPACDDRFSLRHASGGEGGRPSGGGDGRIKASSEDVAVLKESAPRGVVSRGGAFNLQRSSDGQGKSE